jgi:hypothetical protein
MLSRLGRIHGQSDDAVAAPFSSGAMTKLPSHDLHRARRPIKDSSIW